MRNVVGLLIIFPGAMALCGDALAGRMSTQIEIKTKVYPGCKVSSHPTPQLFCSKGTTLAIKRPGHPDLHIAFSSIQRPAPLPESRQDRVLIEF